MNTLKKAMIGTAAATAMAVSATPAMANDYNRGGISAGEVIAGAVVIGAIAAIASSGKKDRYDYDDRYRGDRYNTRISSRQAVNECVRATERKGSHYGSANVTKVRNVDRTRNGYKVNGSLAVHNAYRRGADRGEFTCHIDGNRVADVRLKNLKYRR